MTEQDSILAADDVLCDLIKWRRQGQRAALVTLVNIDGATPRPLGAQMAVAEDGTFTGYLSGGCLEQTVVKEAMAVIAARTNKLERYGKGSRYFDIRLPCGSGLDLYFDQGVSDDVLSEVQALRLQRKAFYFETNIENGSSHVVPADVEQTLKSETVAEKFRRAHIPIPKVLLAGSGPILTAVARLMSVSGFGLSIYSPDEETRRSLDALGLSSNPLTGMESSPPFELDRWSASVVAFHEHDWEAPLLAHILRTPCFYIGVQGSKAAHAARIEKLSAMGFSGQDLARVRGPIGSIPGARSRATLAVGILAELTAEAKAHGMIA